MNIKKYSNYSVIERYSRSEKIDNKIATEHFNALKQFLSFCTKTEKPCFPSKQLDEIWHTFILYTQDYYSFCKDGLGKFVHHIPFNSDYDRTKNFRPGYFCFIDGNVMKKKYVTNLTQLDTIFKVDCGSGGDCSNTSSCSSCKD
jgi:hypothetical protein